MGQGAKRIAFAGMAAIAALGLSDDARAANGAYVVDAADVGEAGSCKVESWLQAATNTDFMAVANPSCVVNIFRPVELSLQTVRSRSDGDWSTSIAPKAKWNIAPTGIGRLGVAFSAGGVLDAMTGENLTAFAVVPATYRLTETTRINLNAGWLWDRRADRHYLIYGLGFDWKLTETLQWTIETFGQAGTSDIPSVVRPRFQTGVTSSTAVTFRAKMPTGSPLARRSGFPYPVANPIITERATCELPAQAAASEGASARAT